MSRIFFLSDKELLYFFTSIKSLTENTRSVNVHPNHILIKNKTA